MREGAVRVIAGMFFPWFVLLGLFVVESAQGAELFSFVREGKTIRHEYVFGVEDRSSPPMRIPPKGRPFFDPAFGCEVTRVTDKGVDRYRPDGLANVYSTVDIENQDTYDPNWGWIRVFAREDGQWMLYKIRVFELSAGKHSMYIWTRERETNVDCYYLTNDFNEQPVFPDEVPGFAAVDPAKKLAITWGSLK